MGELDDLLRSRATETRVVGTYLWPTRIIGQPQWADPYSLTSVISTLRVGKHRVMITRMGGLFVKPPRSFSDPYSGGPEVGSEDELWRKIEFEVEVARCFNGVICELALNGLVSAPASPIDISWGQLVDGHALVLGGSGGREAYLHRSVQPLLELLQDNWLTWPVRGEETLKKAARMALTRRLSAISETLPELVAGAYSNYSRRQVGEAIADSWVVTEQVVDYLWQGHVKTVRDKARKDRLKDDRTYSASVRAEILLTAGALPEDLYVSVQRARKLRNDLMHSAKMALPAATQCVNAMREAVEFVCGTTVVPPDVTQGVNW